MSTIKTVKNGKYTYYTLWDKGQFIRHIGNASARDKYLSDLKKIEERHSELTGGVSTPEMPTGTFDVIYADPPWRYEFSETASREIENQYPTMELKAIHKLKVPSANNSVLFLWATAPKLQEALSVMNAWEFKYRTCAVWDKEIIGMGYWFRGQHELLLVGVKGDYPAPLPENRYSSVFRERRGDHSTKPEMFYELIEKMFPRGKYLEMFARSKRPGWEAWGNQC